MEIQDAVIYFCILALAIINTFAFFTLGAIVLICMLVFLMIYILNREGDLNTLKKRVDKLEEKPELDNSFKPIDSTSFLDWVDN